MPGHGAVRAVSVSESRLVIGRAARSRDQFFLEEEKIPRGRRWIVLQLFDIREGLNISVIKFRNIKFSEASNVRWNVSDQ